MIKCASICNSLPSEILMKDELHTFVRLLDEALSCTDLVQGNLSTPYSDIAGSLPCQTLSLVSLKFLLCSGTRYVSVLYISS